MVLVFVATAFVPWAVAPALAGTDSTNVSRGRGPSGSPSCVVDASGTIHVAWTDRPEATDYAEQFVYYARSFDGATFEAPRRVSAGVDDGARAREARIVADLQGSVSIAWWASVPGEDDRLVLTAFLVRSNDAGASFGPPVASSLRFREDQLGDRPLSVTTTLSLAAAPDGGVGLLASVPDYDRGYNIYFASSSDGVDFEAPVKVSRYTQVIPRGSTNALAYGADGRVVTFWTESNGDFLEEIKDVYSATSTDGGRTFAPPRRVPHVRGLVGGALPVGDAIVLVTNLKRAPNSRVTVKAFRSTNGGTSFTDRTKLAKASISCRLHQASIAANAAGLVAVTWVESGSNPPLPHGIYVAVSRDGGATFDEPMLALAGFYPDPPSIGVGPDGGFVVAFTSSNPNPVDREVLVLRMEP